MLHGFAGAIDIFDRAAGQPADGAPADLRRDRSNGVEVALRADRKPGLDDIDTHRLKMAARFRAFRGE